MSSDSGLCALQGLAAGPGGWALARRAQRAPAAVILASGDGGLAGQPRPKHAGSRRWRRSQNHRRSSASVRSQAACVRGGAAHRPRCTPRSSAARSRAAAKSCAGRFELFLRALSSSLLPLPGGLRALPRCCEQREAAGRWPGAGVRPLQRVGARRAAAAPPAASATSAACPSLTPGAHALPVMARAAPLLRATTSGARAPSYSAAIARSARAASAVSAVRLAPRLPPLPFLCAALCSCCGARSLSLQASCGSAGSSGGGAALWSGWRREPVRAGREFDQIV